MKSSSLIFPKDSSDKLLNQRYSVLVCLITHPFWWGKRKGNQSWRAIIWRCFSLKSGNVHHNSFCFIRLLTKSVKSVCPVQTFLHFDLHFIQYQAKTNIHEWKEVVFKCFIREKEGKMSVPCYIHFCEFSQRFRF